VKENSDALVECLRLDLGRPKQEAIMGDIAPSLERILINTLKLEEWTKPIEPIVSPWQQSWRPRVEKHPKGVILIVA
jgi:aldehyde dehydrogenase (NAD+)